MFRATALKELREIRGITLLALAACIYTVVACENPKVFPFLGGQMVPFVLGDYFLPWFVVISAAMSIALGLRQTLGESLGGTYPFLLHRPADRRWLIGVKLLVGMSVYLICTAIPILAHALWAATPGTHASPFQWSMTVAAWEVWFGMTLLYLGAFLSGIRPARWYRSRILPLVAAALATVLLLNFPIALGESLWPCVSIFLADVWIVAAIFIVVRTRDYA